MEQSSAKPSAQTKLADKSATDLLRQSMDQTLQRGQISHGISQAVQWSLHHQDPDGYWAGMARIQCLCIEAEWILAFHILGVDHPQIPGLVRGLLDRQREDGSWDIYHKAPKGDINATVETYAALRCTGLAADDPALVKAREWIFTNGGLREVRVFTRYWLALIGEWPWHKTPNLPPEVIRFPLWFPFNIYNFACWARATLLPLAVLSADRPVHPLAPDRRLDELFPGGRQGFDYELPKKPGLWAKFFYTADRCLHTLQNLMPRPPGRKAAIHSCLEWIIRHQDADGAWGGIQPPWIYSLMALHQNGVRR